MIDRKINMATYTCKTLFVHLNGHPINNYYFLILKRRYIVQISNVSIISQLSHYHKHHFCFFRSRPRIILDTHIKIITQNEIYFY